MIGHYLKMALAKFRRSPFTTGANILTLALGLACFIAAWGVAAYWRSGDADQANVDRIVLISQTVSAPGESAAARFNPASSATLARYLPRDVPGLDHVARAFRTAETAVIADEQKALLDVVVADASILDIFEFQFVSGGARDALAQPDAVILSRDAAQRLYGDAPALGRQILVDGRWQGTVTAIVAPTDSPSVFGARPDSMLHFDILANWTANPEAVARDSNDVWNRSNGFTFALRSASLDSAALDARLARFIQTRVPADVRDSSNIVLRAIPIFELATRSMDAALSMGGAHSASAVQGLLGLGLFILAVAALNYANLATAQAVAHSAQTGLRRAIGASSAQVMLQFWLETLVLTAASAVIAMAALLLAAPVIRALTGVDLGFVLRSGEALAIVAILIVLVSLAAGAYPALALARVRPTQALRAGGTRGGPKMLARILVGVQFAAASFLLIMVATAQLQQSYLERLASPPDSDPVAVLNDLSRLDINEATLLEALRDQPGIVSATITDRAPWSEGRAVFGFARSGDAAASVISGYFKVVREDYFQTFDLNLLAGRVFDPARETEPVPFDTPEGFIVPVVVDRAYAARLGFTTPQRAVDQMVYIPGDGGAPATPFRIVGVVETEVTRLGASDVGGHIYGFTEWRGGSSQFPIVRLARGDVARGVASINAAWDRLSPNAPANIRFTDVLFERSFRAYSQISQFFTTLASAALVIASVGLVGIAVHVTARRRREIGVRKTLGATRLRVLHILLADFSKPVLIGNLSAWPFAWFSAHAYLQPFAERAPLTPLPFILSLAVSLLIAWLSVGGQVWRAASLKPALVLRAE